MTRRRHFLQPIHRIDIESRERHTKDNREKCFMIRCYLTGCNLRIQFLVLSKESWRFLGISKNTRLPQ